MAISTKAVDEISGDENELENSTDTSVIVETPFTLTSPPDWRDKVYEPVTSGGPPATREPVAKTTSPAFPVPTMPGSRLYK